MNNTVKATITAAVAAVVTLGAVAGCGASGTAAKSDQGKVYFLNSKPEVSDSWKKIADEYTKQTGVPVTVETAASGTYQQSLKSEFAKSEPPTLFQLSGPVDMETWKDYMADLTDTAIYKQMKDQTLALKSAETGKPVGVPFVIESYGLIYNKDILDKYTKTSGAAVKSVKDINSFAKLKAVADGMQKHKDELGIKGAFTSAGFDSSSIWRYDTHLANMALDREFKDDGITQEPASIKGTYLPQFKNIFDLYLTDSTTPRTQLSSKTNDDANSEFALGDAAFYQNGTWAWTDLQNAGMDADKVGMIPIYMGLPNEHQQGLATGSAQYWCLNKKADSKNIKATEKFLDWMITSEQGKDAIAKDMGFTTPFKTFNKVKTDNPLVAAMQKDSDSKRERVGWSFTVAPSERWKDDLGSAMLEYAQGTAGWDGVQKAFVDNWAREYQANKH